MRNPPPPAHYNPPPMFGLRTPEDWPSEWIPGPLRLGGHFTIIASDDFAGTPSQPGAWFVTPPDYRYTFGDVMTIEVQGKPFPPPLTSGTDAEP